MDVKEMAEMVRQLRSETGAGIYDCKKALVNSDGNKEEAIKWLKENAGAKRMITYR